jgi:uncharacterized protein (DUF433 family)
MKLPDFLTEGAFGEVRLTGHRIGLDHVIEDYNSGYSPERLHEEFPTLPLDLIQKVLAFYEANRAEVDAYMARGREDSERHRRAAKPIDVEELMARLEGSRCHSQDGP